MSIFDVFVIFMDFYGLSFSISIDHCSFWENFDLWVSLLPTVFSPFIFEDLKDHQIAKDIPFLPKRYYFCQCQLNHPQVHRWLNLIRSVAHQSTDHRWKAGWTYELKVYWHCGWEHFGLIEYFGLFSDQAIESENVGGLNQKNILDYFLIKWHFRVAVISSALACGGIRLHH